MKFWMKMLIVIACGGSIWGLSFLASAKPEMGMMLASVNVAIMAVCSFLTGYPAPKDGA